VVVTANGGTTLRGAFGLNGPVAAGLYEYLLFRGGVTPGNEYDFFLRNRAAITARVFENIP
jgi:autotransporter family porin